MAGNKKSSKLLTYEEFETAFRAWVEKKPKQKDAAFELKASAAAISLYLSKKFPIPDRVANSMGYTVHKFYAPAEEKEDA